MATPYIAHKVSSGYHQSQVHPNFECNPNKCRFSYDHWCPTFEVRQNVRFVRRRCKSESFESDPLREHNRPYETPYQSHHWKRKVVKDYDLHSPDTFFNTPSESFTNYEERRYQSIDGSNNVENCGVPVSSETVVSNYEERGYQSFNGSSNMENNVAELPFKKVRERYEDNMENNVAELPFKKVRERLLPIPVHTSRTYEPWTRQTHDNHDYNCSKHFTSCGNGYSIDMRRNHRSSSPSRRKFDSQYRRKNGVTVSSSWVSNTEDNQEYNESKCPSTCTLGNYYSHCTGGRGGDAFLCPSRERRNSYYFNTRNRQFGPASLQEPYVRDVENLRSKVRVLRGGTDVEDSRSKVRELRGGTDGKRLRQRSDSEPVAGSCNEGEKQESKRARDISPSLHDHEVTSSSAPETNGCSGIHLYEETIHCVHNTQLPCDLPKMKKKSAATRKKKIPVLFFCSSDEFLDEFCSMDDSDVGEVGEDSDDDLSVISSNSLTTNSNTPSIVGECLGAISISESSKVSTKSCVSYVPTNGNEDGLPACFRASLFSHVPPFVNFVMAETEGEPWPQEIAKHLKWKQSPITPLIVRRTLTCSGFKLVKKSNEWCGTWGKHMKCALFKGVKDFQKINHFPGTFQIGRKDRLWKNLHRLMLKFGEAEFGFIPRTYVLPQDMKMLRQVWKKGHGKWIIKPPASARGSGIKVIHRWAQLPKKPLVVQKYISDPYLINGSKFDLRLYVLVTSMNPLRIYLYDDGLVRFASVKYSSDVASLGDRYMHLTNYSINKLSSHYTQNEDASACMGHKWTVKSLWKFLRRRGVDVTRLWDNLVDMVIKTIISGESSITSMARANLTSRYCSFELFGFDVLLDRALRPWLLEVNISPSLHSASPLDKAVKAPMVRDLFNIAGYQIPNKVVPARQDELIGKYGLQGRVSSLCYDKRLYTTVLSKEERRKHAIMQSYPRRQYLEEVLDSLTPDDIRHLIQTEDELTQSGRFLRVFPTPETYIYHGYFEGPRYYNILLDAWETKYWRNRQEGIRVLEASCRQKKHLSVPKASVGPRLSASQPSLLSMRRDSAEWEEEKEEIVENEMNVPERRVLSASSIALYRAVRPRSGKAALVIKPFPRSHYICKKLKLPHNRPLVTRRKTKLTRAFNSCDSLCSPSLAFPLSDKDTVL